MLQVNFTPFPVLTTERLVLRKLNQSDDQQIFLLRNNKRVNKFIDRPETPTIDAAKNFINRIDSAVTNNESIFWVLNLKNSEKLIGTILYWNLDKHNSVAELGYELFPEYHGQGIMQEALSTVIQYGFNKLKLQAIEAHVDRDNVASIKLLKRNNFQIRDEKESNENQNVETKKLLSYTLTQTLQLSDPNY